MSVLEAIRFLIFLDDEIRRRELEAKKLEAEIRLAEAKARLATATARGQQLANQHTELLLQLNRRSN